MVNEAQKYQDDDNKEAARVNARNGLESYAFGLKNTMSESKDKIPAEDLSKFECAITETTQWLDASASASTEEYQDKQKELESIASPIMSRLVGAASGGDPTGYTNNTSEDGPTVEEVD